MVFYEVWEPLRNANYYMDITNQMDTKVMLLDSYTSQNVWIHYSDRVKGLNIYRGMLCGNVQYAEAFNIMSVDRYLKEKF